MRLPLVLLLLQSLLISAATYRWPSPQYDALERLLYEGRRSDGSSLASIVHPCRKRTGTLASIAAEWLRFAFHDMATYNIDTGSGGLDGSLVYELNRAENFGLGFTQTVSDLQTYPNQLISRADVISIAAILAVSSCGGPIIPFRAGRIDTYVAGGTGTPEPQQDISTLTESFRRQGFNQSEMIKLVSCGHTMGGVRSSDFPQLVPPNPSSSLPVIDDFDETMQFDNLVVTDYLRGKTQNVLVTGSNQTLLSDLRVFESDGNLTMRSLADNNVFQSECKNILARMLNTVPNNVNLTDEITLLPAKVNDGQLYFEQSQLVFKTSLRLIQPINTTASANRIVTMFWCDRYGTNQNCQGKTNTALPVNTVNEDPNLSPVTLNLGYFFIDYFFVIPINSTSSINQFWFSVDDKNGTAPTVYNNGGDFYIVDQDQVFLAPMMSHVDVVANGTNAGPYGSSSVGFTRVYTLVAAVRDGTNPSNVYGNATDIAITNFPYAMNSPITFSLNSTAYPSLQGYSFYTGTIQDIGLQMTLDLHADGSGQTVTQPFVQTLLLDNTPFVAPGTVGSVASTSVGQTTTTGSSSASSDMRGWRMSPLMWVVSGMTVLSMVL
ncbi:L-ascorbate oxidase [Phlegmacium glaucopus]|nr:L-ascorbate oxidase [Phlegmacium glaucopus]